MGTKGAFGFKIGRKIRLMYVNYDADLLWQILVREIFVLMKYYNSIELLREAFISLKDAKGKPKPDIIEKCKIYTDLKTSNQTTDDWYCLLRHCQHSFINILESGYFLNNGNENTGLILVLDFNTNSVTFYEKNNKNEIKTFEKATIEEIMEFEDMPTKSLTEIVTDMKETFVTYQQKIEVLKENRENVESIINKAKELGNEQNIIQGAKKLLDTLDLEQMKVDMGYRVFYNRLDALNLIDYN